MVASSRPRALRTVIALVTAMTTALVLSGCADDPSDTADGSAAPTSSDTSSPTSSPADAIAEAREASAADHRPVLLDFGADWCADCVVLDGLYEDPGVSSILEKHFHLVKVDVGEFDKNLDVADDYIDLEASGIPALVVITPDGTIVYASNDGEFANARTMHAGQVASFLKHWAHAV